MKRYEYEVIDIGRYTGTRPTVKQQIDNIAKDGWRLVSAVQLASPHSDEIRHYFEREREEQ